MDFPGKNYPSPSHSLIIRLQAFIDTLCLGRSHLLSFITSWSRIGNKIAINTWAFLHIAPLNVKMLWVHLWRLGLLGTGVFPMGGRLNSEIRPNNCSSSQMDSVSNAGIFLSKLDWLMRLCVTIKWITGSPQMNISYTVMRRCVYSWPEEWLHNTFDPHFLSCNLRITTSLDTPSCEKMIFLYPLLWKISTSGII